MATILGMGGNSGSDTLTVNITVDEPSDSVVQVFPAAALNSLAFFSNPDIVGPTDSRSGMWSGDGPTIGTANDANSGALSGHRDGLLLGDSWIRSGAALQSGDTVTIEWDDGGFGASQMTTIAIVIAFDEIDQIAINQYLGSVSGLPSLEYFNSCASQDQPAFDGKSVNWTDAEFDIPFPSADCKMISAAAAYPTTSGWTPIVGSNIAEYSSDDMAISVCLASVVASLTGYDPGGEWSNSTELTAVNYQFAQTRTEDSGGDPDGTINLDHMEYRVWEQGDI